MKRWATRSVVHGQPGAPAPGPACSPATDQRAHSERRQAHPKPTYAASIMSSAAPLPQHLEPVRNAARRALREVSPAGSPQPGESKALMLSSRTRTSDKLPAYYLLYFLLVDLLQYPKLGRLEKVAWIVPIRYKGRLYSVEHRKTGVGIFAPNLDPEARMSGTSSSEAEADAQQIARALNKAVAAAESYFEWRAELVASTPHLNVVNRCSELYDRYVFFRDRFRSLNEEAAVVATSGERAPATGRVSQAYAKGREARWNGEAAIEAFFSWTEHAFIHLAIVQGHLKSGDEVAALARADWKEKFAAALDLSDKVTKGHYDSLLDLRQQIRNFMAHGSFGKRGEAFHFHSDAGAVPLLLTPNARHRYAWGGKPGFRETSAVDEIDTFIDHLWSGSRLPGKTWLFSELPSILAYVIDGTYDAAMKDEQSMQDFVEHLTSEFDRAANMEW